MIIGHGIDIVNITRFDKTRINRLAERICTPAELDEFKNTHERRQPTYLAKVWAVKESVAKAFGTGIRGNTTWKNIELRSTSLGQPQIYLKDPLFKFGTHCHTSISHDGDYLIASTILEYDHY